MKNFKEFSALEESDAAWAASMEKQKENRLTAGDKKKLDQTRSLLAKEKKPVKESFRPMDEPKYDQSIQARQKKADDAKKKIDQTRALLAKEKKPLSESHAELSKHISDFSKGVKSSSAKQSTYKRDGKPISNMKHIETDSDHQAVFKHLQKMGYKKTSGYDPKPHEFDMHHNRDEMTSKSDPVHHSSGVSAHVEKEHGSKMKVHFTHRGIKEHVEEILAQDYITTVRDYLQSKEELGEAHKLGDKVIINKGPSYVVGKTGHIGEIRRHYIGAPKTYTIDHDDGSIQLKSTHFKAVKAVKEEVEEIDELSSDLLKQYKKNASDAATAADKAGKYDIGHKRFKGILKATFKQFANDAKKNG